MPAQQRGASRLTYDDMQTNSGEFFARLDTPWNFFVKGFIGGGWTNSGHMNDEDFGLPPGRVYAGSPYIPYSNTLSSLVNGNIGYGVIDAGYDFLQGSNYKVGAFAGYFYMKQHMSAFGCMQIANQNSACGGNPAFPAFPNNGIPIITEDDTWNALRIGLAGEAKITDRFKLSGDAAYLPYVSFNGVDNHDLIPTAIVGETFPEWSHSGQGVQLEGLLSYYVTPTFSVGVGGRFWAMWTTNGEYTKSFPALPAGTPNQFFRGTAEQAGAFVQASYKFGVPASVAAKD
jgi:outer membrane protease